MTTIRAAVARETGAPFAIEQLHLDDIRRDEVRVRMIASGICHTDALARDGVYPPALPAVLGHEGAGVVEEVGAAVTGFRAGDHVLLGSPYCGQCRCCRAGQSAYCEDLFAQNFAACRADGSTALTGAEGQRVASHFFGQSSFGNYANVRATGLVVVSEPAPLEMLAALGCGLSTGAGSVLTELRPRAGSSFVVTGAGAVGLAAVMAAAVVGCTTIVAIDLHPQRLALALELGATHAVSPAAGAIEDQLRELTGGRGVDFVLDTTAVPSVLAAAARALAIRGTLALVGAAAPGTEVAFEIGESLPKGWTFTTIIQGSSVPQDFLPRLVELWRQGRFPFDRLVRTYPIGAINEAFADSASGAVVKPVVLHDHRLPHQENS